MLRPAAALLLSLALVAGLAACGQSAGEKFKEAYKPLDADIKHAGVEIGRALGNASSQSDAEFAQTFGKLATQVDGLVKHAGRLSPPSDLRKTYTTMVGGLKRSRDDLQALSQAGTNSDPAAAQAAAIALRDDAPAVSRSRRKIAKQLGL